MENSQFRYKVQRVAPEILMDNNEIKKEWNEIILRNGGSFLQSWEWAQFQESTGAGILRFNNSQSMVLLIKHKLPFGKSYLYCPRGPVEKNESLLKRITDKAKKEGVIFLTIDPEWFDAEESRKILKDAGFQKSPKEIQPKKTLILDISKSEEELLDSMHPKTRYNIHLAERHGVKIHEHGAENIGKYFDEFWKLMLQTAKRDKFQPHPKEYYKKMLEIPFVKLFLAQYKNKIIAANIIIFFGRRATYLHGASSNDFRNLMAPYLLQWEQIRAAKIFGCAEYDFWGIDEKKWPGITRFKKGFGGREVEYIGAQDLIFQRFNYNIYKIIRTFQIL